MALAAAAAIGFAGMAAAQSDDAVDPDAIAAVKAMSEKLGALTAFSLTSGLVHEVVLESGQKLSVIEHLEIDAQKPKGVRIERTGADHSRVFYFDGKTVTIWGPMNRFYTSVEFEGTNAEMIEAAAEKYAIELPLADLFLWTGSDEQVGAIKSAFYVGASQIDDRVCEHYAFRQEAADWELWIDEDGDGLPCAYSITDLSDEAHPVFRATVSITPKYEIADGRFTFTPPEDSLYIPIVEAAEAAKKE